MESQAHLGVWTNWSRGPIMGPTLTLSRTHGNLLIAFTASFIAFVSARFWHILCVALHRHYSSPLPASTLHHQRQIILRNSSSPESGLWSFISLCFAWRPTNFRQFLQLAPALCLAVFTMVAFLLAGGFSSTIASGVGDVILLTGNKCGFINRPKDATSMPSFIATLADRADTAAKYAQQCYSNNRSGLVDCGRFVKDSLSWEFDNNASCPFSPEMCRNDEGNLRLDTGQIDLNTALGLNFPADERLSIRSVLHCAPLVTEGYSTQVSTSNSTLVRYHYGRGVYGTSSNFEDADYTYEVEDLNTQYQYLYKNWSQRLPSSNYQLV